MVASNPSSQEAIIGSNHLDSWGERQILDDQLVHVISKIVQLKILKEALTRKMRVRDSVTLLSRGEDYDWHVLQDKQPYPVAACLELYVNHRAT